MNLAAILLDECTNELASTRRVLEAIPDDQFSYKPHPKSSTTQALAAHIADNPTWGTTMLSTEEFDMDPGYKTPEPGTKDALLELFDKNAEEFLSHLRKANDELLEGRWVMTFSGQSFIDGPRHDALRTWAISHMIHHRAQLALYLRLMGAKVPGCYGPTADDAPPAG